MKIMEKAINSVAGGKVLDIATQEGHFVRLLSNNLQSYKYIIGIDINEQAIKTAQGTSEQENIQFLVMDAGQLGFDDESFDTVSISASFHHLSNIQRVLDEMTRVLKPEGNLIVAEMHRDGQTEAELTSVLLHHWAADVDTALGGLHNRTLARQEIVDYITHPGFSQLEFYDYVDRDSDPMEKAVIEQLDDLITRVNRRAETTAAYEELTRRGEDLRHQLHKVGAQREPILVAIGKK